MGTSATGSQRLSGWLDELASDAAVPGGGPAAGVAAAMGAALVAMVGRLTVGRERFADVEPRMREIVARADEARERFLALADRDAEVFDRYMEALRMPKESDEQRGSRRSAIEAAAVAAADVPLEVAERAVELLPLAAETAASGNPHAASDGACAAACLHAAAYAALASVRINAASMSDAAMRRGYVLQAIALQERATALLHEANERFSERLPS